ncbi:hypothetical protein shim_37430 [Shimia sp. SK013]|uniref:DUF2793 domain-containing protein n=1 Tax=Shimia sp. SK013 TaxID=1389006 RepID=UPI0006B4F40F|nr:DUF2793 domain-containing protein [Shimia sp. SK013]KPA19784.1 hypothetical protein shim_37430 [Shimia sp. SK013]
MSDRSPNLDMPFLMPSQAQKHVTHNEALQVLDAIVQLTVGGFGATTPPSAPEAGDRYALGNGASGDWAGQDGLLAHWDGTGWMFIAPQSGWRAWGQAEAEMRVYGSGGWVVPSHPLLGVNTNADSTNRLSVSSAATLLSNEGNGHQLKINKADTSDTGSLLFQTNWTGHAEMGLAGDDNWSIKVSADGATWTEALRVDNASGLVSGAAVQADGADHTPGRLMRADYGYGPANLVGTVSQSGNVPTGAAIERGSSANGDFTKFADGTLECWATVDLAFAANSRLTGTWDFPVGFVAQPIVSGSVNATSFKDNATPNIAEIGALVFEPIGVGSLSMRAVLYRLSGTTNFDPADSTEAYVRAIGRWY